MPWCPKCKSEYREGFRVCADCGCALVEELREDGPAASGPIEEIQGRETVPFTVEEREQIERIRESAAAQSVFQGNASYQDSSERADENRSAAWVLMVIGILGLIFVILSMAEVIPIKPGSPYLFNGVLASISLLFLVAGMVSMKSAKRFAAKGESENTLRSTMLDWCRENLSAEEIDSKVCTEDMQEEIRYFSRTSYIKEKLNHQFINLDQDFLDQFVDDSVYGMLFGQKTQDGSGRLE